MDREKLLRTKTYILLAGMVVFGSTGDVLLGRGMKEHGSFAGGSPEHVAHFFLTALGRGTVWLGIGMLLLFFVSYLLVLSWADLSYVSPASAIGYALVAVMSYLFLGEQVPPARWMGIALICVGVALVGGTHPSTKESA